MGEQVREHARQVASALSPGAGVPRHLGRGGPVELEDPVFRDYTDPLYGQTYLPRKFKIGFAMPPLNDVDILANCCGFVAIAGAAGELLGYNLTAGGGMGVATATKRPSRAWPT